MRKKWDRLRHAISFEILLILIATPLLHTFLQMPTTKLGIFGILSSLTATILNYVYNLCFDHMLLALKRPLYPRGFRLRLFHSIIFEILVFLAVLPLTIIYLRVSLLRAFHIDIGYTLLVPIYALIFNWLYDILFPVGNKKIPPNGEIPMGF